MNDSGATRWKQRFENFLKALSRLQEAVELEQQKPLSYIEQQGFIKAFEFTHELAWNVMKDYALYQGQAQIMGSRDATRYAFKVELITHRNKAADTYNEAMAKEVIDKTAKVFYLLFNDFKKRMQLLNND